MSLRKRLRILYAALTQEWREVTCPVCGFMWFTQQDGSLWPTGQCVECEQKEYEEFIRRTIAPKGVGA